MKRLFSLIASLTTMVTSLSAAPQAVVFDWGNVIGFNDRFIVVNFICDSLHLSVAEFESANLEKKKAMKTGKSDTDFWIDLAQDKGIQLPKDWAEQYTATLKRSVGADPKMYELVNQLKEKGLRVGLLSNIDDRYTKLIRDFGFYKPFDPCLLSCEMGLEKPDPKAYELLLKSINLPADEIIFIDDKTENVEAAKKLGIDAIVFESLPRLQNELIKREILEKKADYPIYFVLTHPRSTGTAFEKIMRTHGDIEVVHQPFLDPFVLRWLPAGDPYLKNIALDITYDDVINKLFQLAKKDSVFLKEQGYIMLDHFKAHPDFYRNPQLRFAFLIRDPAKSIISCYRKMPSIDNTGIGLVGHEQLWELFNMIKDATGKAPLVIDSDELLKNPLPILNKLGESWGMTFTEKDLKWEKGYVDEWLHIDGSWYVEVSDSTQLEPYRGDIPREADGTPKYAEVKDLQARKRLQDMYHGQIDFYQQLLQYAIKPSIDENRIKNSNTPS